MDDGIDEGVSYHHQENPSLFNSPKQDKKHFQRASESNLAGLAMEYVTQNRISEMY